MKKRSGGSLGTLGVLGLFGVLGGAIGLAALRFRMGGLHENRCERVPFG